VATTSTVYTGIVFDGVPEQMTSNSLQGSSLMKKIPTVLNCLATDGKNSKKVKIQKVLLAR
jgi:hypothetical protein